VSGPFQALVLAAGSGARFGGGKLTAPFRGELLIDGALAAAFAAPAERIFLVWGADPEVPKAAERFAGRRGDAERLVLVEARDHASGLSASLGAGIQRLPARTAAAFVFLGDMPRVPLDLPRRLADQFSDAVLASAPVCKGVRGHPALLSRALFPELLKLEGDHGAKRLLDRLGTRLALLDVEDDGVLFDIDLREDLQRP
jgi:molybdenum cofactor cytidylyltransferase